jgi:hypothetical protein
MNNHQGWRVIGGSIRANFVGVLSALDKSPEPSPIVIPAKAGIRVRTPNPQLDTGFRRYDEPRKARSRATPVVSRSHPLVLLALLVLTARTISAQVCPGDLNGDGQTTVDELVTSVRAALDGCESVAPPPELSALLGTWRFTTTIDEDVYDDNYRLEEIEDDFIYGTDLDQDDDIVAARTNDLIDEPFPYAFALLDPADSFCDFFLFNLTTANTVSGVDYLTVVDGEGDCAELDSGPFPMTGVRLAAAASAARRPVPIDVLRLRQALRLKTAQHAGAAASGPPRAAANAVLHALRRATH